ncbi:RNA polymerase sigma-70 factor (ECF subfamily) [Luteibacter rhizovicinus]|uniref:RNA polymerase sigma factor n=1 Tax=Luteibacter rhizovicinus TaxID=242606 RepID=A0A4R3Z0E9_9GAMM|nr:RNA polymerase sigma factor [Luteibacter rhizovicinus]TCV97678.1 RNA polymerase sigma-70 factor (ECF subfamily) [Luteibacter rhizovicinus]
MPVDPLDDRALVARVRFASDQHAFATLVRKHQGPLRAWLRRLLSGDEATADDLAQETFLLAYRKLDSYRGEASFSTWLHSIAYRQFLMQRRKNGPATMAFAEPFELIEAPVRENLAAVNDVRRALAELSADEYSAIEQCYYFERSHSEAAEVLESAVGTIKSRVLRAKAKLRQSLAAWATEDTP